MNPSAVVAYAVYVTAILSIFGGTTYVVVAHEKSTWWFLLAFLVAACIPMEISHG